MIRQATLSDLSALVELETSAFSGDRMSRASYRRLLQGDTATILVAQDPESQLVVASAVILYRLGLAAARLYSLAVLPSARGKGLAKRLFEAILADIVSHDRLILRLEVREDNQPAIGLYEKFGCHQVGRIEDYYEDGAAALRYERVTVENHRPPTGIDVPYYAQTTEFTCGTACVVMALAYFSQDTDKLSRNLELDMWRESTTIFMLRGHGGCSAEGLALTAHTHGLVPAIYRTDDGTPFVETVRDPKKKAVIELVHQSFREKLAAAEIPVEIANFGKAEIMAAIDKGHVPLILVSGYRLYREKAPHWVVVTGYDEHFIYIHDPYVGDALKEFVGQNVPIHEAAFTLYNRWGSRNARMMVVISGLRESFASQAT